MALTSGLLDQYWRRYNQRRALTGLPSSYQETRGMLDPMLEYGLKESQRQDELKYRNQQLDMQRQAQSDASRAATVSGVTGLASTGLSGYLGYKYLTKDQAPGAVSPAVAGAPLGSSVPSMTAPAYTGAGSTVPASATSGMSGVEYGSGVGVGSGGGGLLTGAGSGATTTAPVAASGGSTAGGAAAASEGAGLGSTFGAVAGPAALAGGVGGFAANKLGLFGADHPDTGAAYAAGGTGGALAGAAAGAAMTSWSGPGAIVGAVVGGIVGLVSSSDMSVICSELCRQKEITERDRTKCVVFRFRYIPDDMFAAYLEWAKPHVEAMKKGGWRNRIRLPFAHRFIRYMIAIQEHRVPSFSERMVWKYAWSRCEKIARRSEQSVLEVA